ncbi:hypothetical protein A0H81_13775 [Grifola frondosa]|uniref:G domain-containing protein n=1 Tax=Grifola frondosa TaxID=5627 RepID=A0A1C7LQ10_GRIFR|nr:hypothetical protein A0H81_13775 [Grifola frondosa]
MSSPVNEQTALIAVMGPTGSGKTAFINLVSGSNLRVGNGLESCTDEIGIATPCKISGKDVLLVDTPGFDDTQKTQADILKEIAAFLRKTYENGRKLTGIIYMHRISDFRMSGIARENFRLFRKTCGDDAMKNVVIVTNMWGEVKPERGEERERELMTKSIFFKDSLDHGARMHRHYNTIESAHTIIRLLIGNVPETLQMQRELVDEHKAIAETEAGVELRNELKRQEQRHRQELGEVQDEIKALREMLKADEESHQREMDELREACNKLSGQVARIEEERVKLLVDNAQQEEKINQLLAIVSQGEQDRKLLEKQYEDKLEKMQNELDTRRARESSSLQSSPPPAVGPTMVDAVRMVNTLLRPFLYTVWRR